MSRRKSWFRPRIAFFSRRRRTRSSVKEYDEASPQDNDAASTKSRINQDGQDTEVMKVVSPSPSSPKKERQRQVTLILEDNGTVSRTDMRCKHSTPQSPPVPQMVLTNNSDDDDSNGDDDDDNRQERSPADQFVGSPGDINDVATTNTWSSLPGDEHEQRAIFDDTDLLSPLAACNDSGGDDDRSSSAASTGPWVNLSDDIQQVDETPNERQSVVDAKEEKTEIEAALTETVLLRSQTNTDDTIEPVVVPRSIQRQTNASVPPQSPSPSSPPSLRPRRDRIVVQKYRSNTVPRAVQGRITGTTTRGNESWTIMFEGYRGQGPTLGCIVKIISSQSVYRGTYGFVYKLHDSGRIGVKPVNTTRKVTYTIKGIQIVTNAPAGEEHAFSEAARHRNAHFGLISVNGVPGAPKSSATSRECGREAEREQAGLVVHLTERVQDEIHAIVRPYVETVLTDGV